LKEFYAKITNVANKHKKLNTKNPEFNRFPSLPSGAIAGAPLAPIGDKVVGGSVGVPPGLDVGGVIGGEVEGVE